MRDGCCFIGENRASADFLLFIIRTTSAITAVFAFYFIFIFIFNQYQTVQGATHHGSQRLQSQSIAAAKVKPLLQIKSHPPEIVVLFINILRRNYLSGCRCRRLVLTSSKIQIDLRVIIRPVMHRTQEPVDTVKFRIVRRRMRAQCLGATGEAGEIVDLPARSEKCYGIEFIVPPPAS